MVEGQGRFKNWVKVSQNSPLKTTWILNGQKVHEMVVWRSFQIPAAKGTNVIERSRSNQQVGQISRSASIYVETPKWHCLSRKIALELI